MTNYTVYPRESINRETHEPNRSLKILNKNYFLFQMTCRKSDKLPLSDFWGNFHTSLFKRWISISNLCGKVIMSYFWGKFLMWHFWGSFPYPISKVNFPCPMFDVNLQCPFSEKIYHVPFWKYNFQITFFCNFPNFQD